MREALLKAARAYARAARVPLSVVSKRAYGNSRFFAKVSRKASFQADTYDDVMEWFDDPKNWPNETIPPGAVVDLFVPQQLAKDHAPCPK